MSIYGFVKASSGDIKALIAAALIIDAAVPLRAAAESMYVEKLMQCTFQRYS